MHAYSCLHPLILMNKTKDQTSRVLSHDLYWENKMYKPKRSIRIVFRAFILTGREKVSFCNIKKQAQLRHFFIGLHLSALTSTGNRALLVNLRRRETKTKDRKTIALLPCFRIPSQTDLISQFCFENPSLKPGFHMITDDSYLLGTEKRIPRLSHFSKMAHFLCNESKLSHY